MSEIKKKQNSIIVKPGKDLVASVVTEFSNELKPLIEEHPKEIVVDMESVDMVDSLGMGVLIATHNSLADNSSILKVINIKEDIYNAFITMRLDHHFIIKKDSGTVKKSEPEE
jgi:anti-sigma B factor antagonist